MIIDWISFPHQKKDADDVYPAISAAGSNSVSLVFNPTLPAELEDVVEKKQKEEEPSYLTFAFQNATASSSLSFSWTQSRAEGEGLVLEF